MNFLRNVLVHEETYIRQHLIGQVSRYFQLRMITISILLLSLLSSSCSTFSTPETIFGLSPHPFST